jgi:RNA polymerase sigma-70 factor (sigma-E family)
MPHGDDSDFVEYVSARLARLHRAAYFMCGDAHRADDLVQATLVSLYAHWKHARTAENLDGYVHRILTRRLIDEQRSRWARVILRDRLPETVAVPAVEPDADHDTVVAALRRLPVGQRAVIVLRYYSELSVEETATALGCSVGNVKSQCSRGLATLREALVNPDGQTTTTPKLPTAPRSQALRAVTHAHGR